MPLPAPVGCQKDVLCLPTAGHFAVLGTAGSGKTTLAILRAAYLADPDTNHGGRTLLVTFNRALVAYLNYLADGTALQNVTVENYHRFARGYLNSQGRMSFNDILDSDERENLVRKAVAEVAISYEPHSFFSRPVPFFVEEVRWLSQHCIRSYEGYADTERVDRAGSRLTQPLRKPMFEIYQAYQRLRAEAGRKYDWDDLALAVIDGLKDDHSERRYRHVVIDEGQDFSPAMIRSLAAAIPAHGSLTFFGDVAQQIYGHRMSWRSAGLNVTKVWEFKQNYRNTRQIARLGLAIASMPYYRGAPDLVEPVSPAADGPLPALVRCCNPQREVEVVIEQAVALSRNQSVGIFVRARADEDHLASLLPKGSVRLHKDLKHWPAGPGVRYGTYHSAKGLEFNAVILPFLSAQRLPDPEQVGAFGTDEASAVDGRLLYVGVTRAKATLIMTYCGERTPLLPAGSSVYEEMDR